MNGKLQGIIICGVTAACLVGVMAFLNSTSGKSDADSSSSSTAAVSSQDESVVILTKSSDDITSVKVSNEHGEYSVNKSESGKSTWSIPELGTLNANANAEASMISNLDGFKAKKLVEENVEDMSKYGLDKPTADLTVEYSDGTATTLHVGSVSPSNERYRYVSLDDEKTVYMVMGTTLGPDPEQPQSPRSRPPGDPHGQHGLGLAHRGEAAARRGLQRGLRARRRHRFLDEGKSPP